MLPAVGPHHLVDNHMTRERPVLLEGFVADGQHGADLMELVNEFSIDMVFRSRMVQVKKLANQVVPITRHDRSISVRSHDANLCGAPMLADTVFGLDRHPKVEPDPTHH